MDAGPDFLDSPLCCPGNGLSNEEALRMRLLKAGEFLSGVGKLPPSEAEIVRHDAALIRELFDGRCPPLESLDPVQRAPQLEEREQLLSAVSRLYAAGQAATPSSFRRRLLTGEVTTLLNALNYLLQAATEPLADMLAEVERLSAQDDDLLAHVMDPLQLRYVLARDSHAARGQLGAERCELLLTAARRADRAYLRAWFEDLTSHLEILSKDTPLYLRSVLLGLWRRGEGDLAGLAYEIAILDVRLFGAAGWENTRAFCGILRRITAPGSEVLDPFLSDEEIDTCLLAVESLRQDELIAHFRRLATSYNTKLHRDLHRSVFHRARLGATPDPTSAPASESVQPWAEKPPTSVPA